MHRLREDSALNLCTGQPLIALQLYGPTARYIQYSPRDPTLTNRIRLPDKSERTPKVDQLDSV